MRTPQRISKAARRVTAELQTPGRPKPPRQPNQMLARSRKAAHLRQKLLTFKENYSLTWEELAYVMKHSDANAILSVITLKRFGLGYTIPYPITLEAVGKFLITVEKMKRQDRRR